MNAVEKAEAPVSMAFSFADKLFFQADVGLGSAL